MGINNLTDRFTANGTKLYMPHTDVKQEQDSLADENSGRNDAGYMEIQFIRTDIKKWSLTYSLMTGDELSYMENLLQAKQFSFHAPFHGRSVTVDCYCSNNSADEYILYHPQYGDLYRNVSFNIIER